jgi:signal transduction histidine kinase
MSDRELAARRLLAVTEEELRRVVLDMHDGPVQSLFAALGQLTLLRERIGAAADRPADRAEWERLLDRATTLLEAGLRDIRHIVTGLHAPEFATHSLGALAEELAVQHETLVGSAVALELAPTLPPVAPIVKIAVYRVLQEALSNIRRHAGAAAARVRLTVEGDDVLLDVADTGRGFDPPPLVGPFATEHDQHIGLRGMRERAAMGGGTLTVESRPGEGTCVRLRIPAQGPTHPRA